MGSEGGTVHCDVVIIGAGFSGVSALYKSRQMNLKAKVFEAGEDFGGVWYWNRYPGARVDSETPFYQLNMPEVYRTWTFSQRFPDGAEIRRYFDHVDKTLNLRRDVFFNARIISATWDEEQGRWALTTNKGHRVQGKYLILGSGLLHKNYTPNFPGLNEYQGDIYHSGSWREDLDLTGRNVAVIGAGATAVQIVQELAKKVKRLTVLMNRPSYCVPMRQRNLASEEQKQWSSYYPRLYAAGRMSRAGLPYDRPGKRTFDVSFEEREAYFEELYSRGAFNYLMCNYDDTLTNEKANRVVYDFWKKKTRERLTDKRKQELMAPDVPPYCFGTKRNPLEQDYYEMLNQDHVNIISLKQMPLKQFCSDGMIMEDGTDLKFDAVVLATGFESFTGSVTNMGLKDKFGTDLKEIWADGISTYLGLMCAGFPNAFQIYSPQAPTALSNGPTIIECQIDLSFEIIAKLEVEGAKSLEPTKAAEKEWGEIVEVQSSKTLFPLTNSWWNGGNIPGRKPQPLTYIGGIDQYEKTCREAIQTWKGFVVTPR